MFGVLGLGFKVCPVPSMIHARNIKVSYVRRNVSYNGEGIS